MEPIIASIVGATISSVIGAIVGAVVVKVKMVRESIEDSKRDNEELRELILQNTKMTCRLAIYDEHFSIDEKLSAYEIYRSHGWNHQTKKYMDELVGGDVDEYLERHEIGS
jgi:predicted GNAT family N-acyltransferase